MVLVAILTVRADARAAFHEFETAAVRVMARYGGALERVVTAPPDDGLFKEVHVLRFPGPAAFAAYRADGELAALAALRASAVVATELIQGDDGPRYACA